MQSATIEDSAEQHRLEIGEAGHSGHRKKTRNPTYRRMGNKEECWDCSKERPRMQQISGIKRLSIAQYLLHSARNAVE
jgi:hypothetical protein